MDNEFYLLDFMSFSCIVKWLKLYRESQMVLNVAGNFCFLEYYESKYQSFIYCPDVHTDVQKPFFDRRFTFIQEKINDIKKGEPLEKSDF